MWKPNFKLTTIVMKVHKILPILGMKSDACFPHLSVGHFSTFVPPPSPQITEPAYCCILNMVSSMVCNKWEKYDISPP